MLQTCQVGFESVLVRELTDAGLAVAESGPGWAVVRDRAAVAGLGAWDGAMAWAKRRVRHPAIKRLADAVRR